MGSLPFVSSRCCHLQPFPYLLFLVWLTCLVTTQIIGEHNFGSKRDYENVTADNIRHPQTHNYWWRRPTPRTTLNYPSSATHHEDRLLSSLNKNLLNSNALPSRISNFPKTSKLSPTTTWQRKGKSTKQLMKDSASTRNYPNSYVDDTRRYQRRDRPIRIEPSSVIRPRMPNGNRSPFLLENNHEETKKRRTTNDRKKNHHKISRRRKGRGSRGWPTSEELKGNSNNNNKAFQLSRNSNQNLKSTNEKLPPIPSISRRTDTRGSHREPFWSSSHLGSGFMPYFSKGRSSDIQNRSHRRQVLDRSYFLSVAETPKEKASRDEFMVPSIQQIPKPSPLKRKRPNIVLMLTDDLDVELGSLNYMPHLLRLMGDEGALFPNAYTTTPMCCPSRSSMLTGMYIHNHQVFTNHQNCSSPLWQSTHERRSFASYLSKAGYKTGYFGKYLNRYNGSHVPDGWKEWAGLVMNSRYYNYTVNKNSNIIKYGNRYPHDYFPHVVTNEGIQFLKSNKESEDPFMLVLSYPSPHGPEDSAPEHAHKFFNASDHHTASYNYAPNPDKQWMLQFTDRMEDIQLKYTDLLMTKRLQTLQTVDAAIQKIVNSIEDIGETNNTYFFFTSDHGYHIGQFGLAKGKSMPFEFDVKVPFLVRGPGIKPGIDLPQIALNIDLAPTFLDIAGLPRPPQMDGRSLLPVLQSSMAPHDAERLQFRDSFLIESSGRLREEEKLEKKEQRTWERERVLTETLLKATSNLDSINASQFPSTEYGGRFSLYTSKHERLEEVCQRLEFASPCQRTQKWHCVKIGRRWKIKKCRKASSLLQKHCICHFSQGLGSFRKLDPRERRKQRNFLKKYLTKDIQSLDHKFIKSFNNINIPLHFASRGFHQQTRWGVNKKRRNRRKRYPRSVQENSTSTSTVVFPFSFDFLNLSRHFTLHPVDDVLKFDESDDYVEEEFANRTDDDLYPLPSTGQPWQEGSTKQESLRNDTSSNLDRDGDRDDDDDYPSLVLDENGEVEDLVHHFVEEEELRDIKDQIHDITDEINSLQSVSTTKDPVTPVNESLIVDSPTHGCQANDGRIDCQDEVYENFSAWRSSKVAIEDKIGRLRQQLDVMKNILQHLQTRKPNLYGIYGTRNYGDFESGSMSEDFYNSRDFEKDINASTPEVEEDDVYKTTSIGHNVDYGNSHEQLKKLKQPEVDFTGRIISPKKKLTLPEVGLDIPLVEDVNYATRTSKRPHKHQGRKHIYHHSYRKDRKRLNNNHDHYDDYDDDSDSVAGKLYYPVSLPTSNESNDSLMNRFCWCDKRVLKKMAVIQAREKKRLERQKAKEKRQRKHKRRRKKSKSESCNYNKLNCYTHDNEHWRTPPLWTDGHFCFCLNSANNTYWCLRTINDTHNFLYCEFITGLITYYDLHIDPYQLRNVAFTLSNEKVLELNEQLTRLRNCKGADECDGWSQNKNIEKKSKTKETKLDGFVRPRPNNDFSIRKSMKRKKIKKFRDRQKKKRLRKERKHRKMEKFDVYAEESWPEDPFSVMGSLEQSIRIPRKSWHGKKGKERRREKKRRRRRKKRKEQRRLARIRRREKITPEV